MEFNFSIRYSHEYSGLIPFSNDWFDLFSVQGTLKSLLQHHNSKASIFQRSAFFTVQRSHPHMTTGRNIALTRHTSFGNGKSLLFITWSRFVIAFLARNKHLLTSWRLLIWGFPRSSVGKESSCSAGDPGSIPGSGRSPGEENGNPLQYSCLDNPVDRGAWRATAHGVTRVGQDLVTKSPPLPLHGCIHPPQRFWRRKLNLRLFLLFPRLFAMTCWDQMP